MKQYKIFILLFAVAALAVSCDKDPEFEPGHYQYENRDLTYLENIGGMLIHWKDGVTEEQKVAVREIAASMVQVDGGTFMMGAEYGFSQADEAPIHQVTLTSFKMAKFTVTQFQWRAIMGYGLDWNPVFGLGDDYPATNMSMGDVDAFIAKLNQLSNLKFRKPTEAQWEYAARGGQKSHGYLYSGSDNHEEVAWCQDNANYMLHPSGLLQPNELGLYDMSGNIWEWCEDRYAPYPAIAQTDPVQVTSGTGRVVRGGSYSCGSNSSQVSARNHLDPSTQSFVVGLRLVMNDLISYWY